MSGPKRGNVFVTIAVSLTVLVPVYCAAIGWVISR